MDLMNCVCTFHKFYKKHLKELTQMDWPVNLTYTFYDLKALEKFEGISMCSFCKNQVPNFRYFVTWKQACNIWKLSKTLKMLFSKTKQGNSLKFFTVVLTNQDLLILL